QLAAKPPIHVLHDASKAISPACWGYSQRRPQYLDSKNEGSREAVRGKKPVPVEMLSQYQDASNERRAALTEVLERLAADTDIRTRDDHLPVTCIVSATHTGSLVAVLRDQIALSSLPIDLEFITLFQLGKAADLPALCDLSDDVEFAPLNNADLDERSAIRIDPQIYFPLTYIDVPHMALAADASPFRPFVDLVQGHRILSVHRNQPSDGLTRHHAIHVDMEQMFALPQFEEALCQSLAQLDPIPSVVLTPQHRAARLLGDMACSIIQRRHGTQPTRVEHTSLSLQDAGPRSDVDRDVRAALTTVPAASSILVLDDCFVTGARMTGYQTRLRQLPIPARLHYLVGLARPDDPKTWTDFRRKLRHRIPADRSHFLDNTISAIFEACMPNWQEARCPWCQEHLLYQSLQRLAENLPPDILARHKLLADRDTGLTDNLFLAEEGSAKIKLYSGSLFAPESSNQAEVFAAVAAAFQHLRVHANGEKPVLGTRRYPIATVLDAEHYLHRTYTDSILRASFLRGAAWEELVYTDPQLEEQRTAHITRILTAKEGDVCNLALELVLAEAVKKCHISRDIDRSKFSASAQRLLALIRSQAGS
ncbi:MAG: hypothetical protein WCC64_14795, partial [Aliidongia sp.]